MNTRVTVNLATVINQNPSEFAKFHADNVPFSNVTKAILQLAHWHGIYNFISWRVNELPSMTVYECLTGSPCDVGTVFAQVLVSYNRGTNPNWQGVK